MANYLQWDRKTIEDFSDKNINAMYDRGFVFTRVGRGVMDQTRSVRIDLSKFKLSSENKRILRKTELLQLTTENLPLSNYSWKVGKMAKDFYDTKFGKGTFSANKVKELLTTDEDNFNRLLVYSLSSRGEAEGSFEVTDNGISKSEVNQQTLTPKDSSSPAASRNDIVGYAITLETNEILHYSYPFYIQDSTFNIPNIGMGMMLRAIQYTKESEKTYIYLGSFQRPTDTYKLQFAGLEWFDGERWSEDLEELKNLITKI